MAATAGLRSRRYDAANGSLLELVTSLDERVGGLLGGL